MHINILEIDTGGSASYIERVNATPEFSKWTDLMKHFQHSILFSCNDSISNTLYQMGDPLTLCPRWSSPQDAVLLCCWDGWLDILGRLGWLG